MAEGEKEMSLIVRLIFRWRMIFSHGTELNRRVEVENELFMMATGKKPLPNAEMCRKLALRLGTPKESWPESLK